jgi:hypothetical protein
LVRPGKYRKQRKRVLIPLDGSLNDQTSSPPAVSWIFDRVPGQTKMIKARKFFATAAFADTNTVMHYAVHEPNSEFAKDAGDNNGADNNSRR